MIELCIMITTLTAFFVRLFYKEREKSLRRDFENKIHASEQTLNLLQKDYRLKSAAAEKSAAKYESELLKLEEKDAYLRKKENYLKWLEAHINEKVRQRISDTVLNISQRSYLSSSPVFKALTETPDSARLSSSLSQRMYIQSPLNISAPIVSESGAVYNVTLYSCTCKDHLLRKTPCKHMYRLAAEVGALLAYDTSSLEQRVSSLLLREKSALEIIASSEKQMLSASKRERDIQALLSESAQTYPWLSKLFSDYFYLQDMAAESSIHTDNKSKASDLRKRLIRENRNLRAQAKAYEYQLHYYENIFPWLEEFKELSPKDAYAIQNSLQLSEESEYESLRTWLSPHEYQRLSSSEKYQLALDRYNSRSKSKWEIGIEYERYIGYLCEQKGYRVQYSGANLGLEDMGRDLILSKDNQRIVIQCKRWAQEKVVHEKHIFQLFGSCILLEQNTPGLSVTGVFVTTAKLSTTALACASRLGIQIYEHIPMGEYPVIKCNISSSGEKIYHLPFDQQYDRVIIDSRKGEFFAASVSDAEAAGFRRAFRHIVPTA